MLSDLPVLTDAEPEKIEWHPNAVDIYKRQVDDLQAALNADDITHETATAALRGLVDRIVACPAKKRGQFDLEPHGFLESVLNLGKLGNGGGGRGIRTLGTVSRTHAFQACALSHSATPPYIRNRQAVNGRRRQEFSGTISGNPAIATTGSQRTMDAEKFVTTDGPCRFERIAEADHLKRAKVGNTHARSAGYCVNFRIIKGSSSCVRGAF